jgi:hypothetical protein
VIGGVYDDLLVSFFSPNDISWKHTSCGVSACEEPDTEAYVKRCDAVLDEPLRYSEYGAAVKVVLGGSAYEVVSWGFCSFFSQYTIYKTGYDIRTLYMKMPSPSSPTAISVRFLFFMPLMLNTPAACERPLVGSVASVKGAPVS